MKTVLLRCVVLAAVLCGAVIDLGAQKCDPNSDPNQCLYLSLPQQPPPAPAGDMQRLSPETAIKTAYDIAKGGMSNPTGEVMDVAIAAIAIGYPPAGIALGIVKGLITAGSGGPDPVGEALKAVNARIDTLQNEFNQLQGTVNQIQNQQFKDENLSRSRWLVDARNTIQRDAAVMSTRPNNQQLTGLLVEAQQTADKFIDDTDLWQWSDLRVHTDGSGVHTDGMQPDFKMLPAFEHYAHALTLWMAELQYASQGNPNYVTGNKNLVRALLKHSAFLSVRPNWTRTSGTAPLTLPEQVMYRSQCAVVLASNQYTGAGQYPDPKTGLCYARMQCTDAQRHTFWALPKPYSDELSWRPANPKTDVCTLSLGRHGESPSDAPEAEMANENGVEAMTMLAGQLRQLAKFGTLATQFIGQFDMTFYSKESLYGVKPNGELLWYGDTIGVDKNPPNQQQPQQVTGNSVLNTPAGIAGRAGAAPRGNSRLNTPASAAAVAGLRSSTKIIHKWDGPKVVGSGWQNFRAVIPGGHSTFYGLTADGTLLWYRHDGVMDGTPKWKGPVQVATGWNTYKLVFGGGDGILYSVDAQGSLNWYKRTDYDEASTLSARMGTKTMGVARQYLGPVRIAAGFGNYTQVFSTGQGIIYAITADGRLLWFQHAGYQAGQPHLLGPKQVGSGWSDMKRVFSTGEGVIYAINKTGELFWYKHEGYMDGTPRWQGPTKIAADWSNFALVFPRMWGTPQTQVIH